MLWDGTLVSIVDYVPNSTLENFSFETHSRHNEDDPPSNRRVQCTSSISVSEVTFKEEPWHNNHITRKTVKLQKPICLNEWYRVADVVSKKFDQIVHQKYVDYGNDGSFELVAEVKYKSDVSDEGLKLPNLYNRWRVNGKMPKGIRLKNLHYYFESQFLE